MGLRRVAAALDATDKDVAIGGAGLGWAAAESSSASSDEGCACSAIRSVVGGGTPFLPPAHRKSSRWETSIGDQDVRLGV